MRNDWALNTYTSYSRMSPCVGFEWKLVIKKHNTNKWKVDRSVSIGVQIQGTSYRHFVEVSHDFAQLESLCSGSHPNGNSICNLYLNPTSALQSCGGCTSKVLRVFKGTKVAKHPKKSELQIFDPAALAPERLTNLKVFNVKQFLYSDFDCGGLDFNELRAAISCSLCIAGALICSGRLDNLVAVFSREYGNNGAALGRGDEETERQDNSVAS